MKKSMMKRLLGIALSVSMVSMLLMGCGAKSGEAETVGEATRELAKLDSGKYSVTYGLAMDPEILDPAFNYNAGRFETLPNICEPLLKMDKDGNLVPGIAKSWEAKDELTYVYEIRPEAKFSDGTAVTADDVVFCLERIMNPETGSTVSWLMASVDSVEKTGDLEVTVHLSKPDASWQYLVATCVGQIYSKAACEEAGASFGDEEHPPVGAGAYKVESWTRDVELKLDLNEYYYAGCDDIDIGEITFKVFADQNAMLVAARNGELDIISCDNDQNLIGEYNKIAFLDLNSVRCYTSMGIFMNTKKAPLDNIDLRKAIAYALDENSFTTSVYGDYAETGNGMMFGSAGYGEYADKWTSFLTDYEYAYSYDMEKAKEYLDKSGVDPASLDLTIIVTSAMESGVKMAQVLQANCKMLGINVNVEKMTLSDYYSAIYGGDTDENGIDSYDFCIMGWGPDYPDAMGCVTPVFYSTNDCAGGANYASLTSDEVDAAIDAQDKETDPDKRVDLVIEACDTLAQQCSYKMLSYPDNIYYTNNKISVPWATVPYWTFFVSDIDIAE